MRVAIGMVIVGQLLVGPAALAQPPAEPEPPAEPPVPAEPPAPAAPTESPPTTESVTVPPPVFVPTVEVHGFVSQGAFKTTHNDYLGHSHRGSLEFTEAGVNFSTEPADRLRIGAQLFTRDVGPVGDYKMTLDWAYLDYRVNPWLGLRAGRIKMPFGLHNEYSDIDSARLPILLPQAVYPITSRDVLLAQTGVAVYGSPLVGGAGVLDYQLFYGTWFIDLSQQQQTGGPIQVTSVDSKYVAGGQVFWRPPVEGLRVGASLVYADLTFKLAMDQATLDQLIMAGVVPPGFDGKYEAELKPIYLWVASAEYAFDEWTFSGEYSRWIQDVKSTLPALVPSSRTDSERFYAMAAYHIHDDLEVGSYYSVKYADVDDREGKSMKFKAAPERAWQRDLAATLRYDVNDSWLWKVEGHFIDGAADLPAADNPHPERYWGLFLVKTTVAF